MNYLANLTDAELSTRLAQLEKLGKATAARLAKGDRGEARGYYIERGRRNVSYSVESALNVQRGAYRDTLAEIRRRAQVAQV